MKGHWVVIHSPENITKIYEINEEINGLGFKWYGYDAVLF